MVLLAENNNFADEPDTIAGAHQLIADLQSIEWEAKVQLRLNEPATLMRLCSSAFRRRVMGLRMIKF